MENHDDKSIADRVTALEATVVALKKQVDELLSFKKTAEKKSGTSGGSYS